MKEHAALQIIVPCYNEQEVIDEFYRRLTDALRRADINDYTLLFVDDGSHDETRHRIEALAEEDSLVHGIVFSRNFGKEAAIYAGIDNSREAEYVVVMDADLQDPPELLPEMLGLVAEGKCERAAAFRSNRAGEPAIRSWFAKRFYRVINRLADLELKDGARDYSVMSRRFADAVLRCGEYNRFTKGLFGWVGFDTLWVEYAHEDRQAGESKWSFWGLVRYAVDGIIAYSTKPLDVVVLMGVLVSLGAFLLMVFVIVRAMLFGDEVAGWPSLMSVMLLSLGFILLALGIVGQYLAKLYLEVKRRPLYIVEREI